MELKNRIKVVFKQLKNKYDGVYLDLEKINNTNKRGLKVIL